MMNTSEKDAGEHSPDQDWDAATWEGSRRPQLRRSLRLTVRERLQALEALAETSERLARLRDRGRSNAGEDRKEF